MGRFNNPASLRKGEGPQPANRGAFGLPKRAVATTPVPRAVLKPAGPSIRPISGVSSAEEFNLAWTRDATNTLRIAGFWFALAFVFTRFSLIHELLTMGFGMKPYAIIILGPPALFLAIISGGLKRSVRAIPGWLMIGFMAWIVLIAPFSSWRTGTLQVLQTTFKTEMVMFFMIAGLTLTLTEFCWMANAIAAGGAMNVLVTRFFGGDWGGRFTMSFGSLGNPNDYATHLMLTAPFLLIYALTGKRPVMRAGAAVFALIAIILVVRTGSRGALLALIVTSAFTLVRAKMRQRIVLAATLALAVLIGFQLVGGSVRSRYLLMFGESDSIDEYSPDVIEARGSSEARRELLRSSIKLTLRHPLMGVGPGQFVTAENELAREGGRSRGAWQVSHNTYTEVSSETGLPGLFLFGGALAASFFILNQIYKRTSRDPRLQRLSNMAFGMMIALVGFGVCIFFSAVSYHYYVPSIAGLVVSFAAVAQREIWAVNNGYPVSAG